MLYILIVYSLSMFSSKESFKGSCPVVEFCWIFHTKPLSEFFCKKIPKNLSDFLIFDLGATTFFIANSFLSPPVSCENTRSSRLPTFKLRYSLQLEHRCTGRTVCCREPQIGSDEACTLPPSSSWLSLSMPFATGWQVLCLVVCLKTLAMYTISSLRLK